MVLSDTIKQKIKDILDSEEFMMTLYQGLEDQVKREELGQFYTPADVCIQMLERFEDTDFYNQDILDPTVGSGNLLIALLVAGANSKRIYGNDYDAVAVELCRKRINRACDILGKPHIEDWQIHQGNALQARCLMEFGPEYQSNYNPEYIDDLEYAQSYEHDEEQTFFGEITVYHVSKISWVEENARAKERLEKKPQSKNNGAQEDPNADGRLYKTVKLF